MTGPRKQPWHPLHPRPLLGWNDPAGVAYCGLCNWSKACGPNLERVEHELGRHLEEAHGRRLRYRVSELGDKVEIPSDD